VLAAVCWSATIFAATPALAKPPKTASSKTSDAARSPASESGSTRTDRSGKKVISLDGEFEIFGKLEKPSAFYVLRRSSLDFDWERLDARFTPLVLESVQDPLF